MSTPRRRPLRERRWSSEAVTAARELDRVSQLVDGDRLAEVEVGGEVVDLRIAGGPELRQCRACGSPIPTKRLAAA